MSDLPGLPPITNAAGQLFGEAKPLVGGLEENRTTVRASVPLVKLHNDGLTEKIRKKNRLLCGNVFHAKASGWRNAASQQHFYHKEALVLSEFANYPG